jgi:hypothetical protein
MSDNKHVKEMAAVNLPPQCVDFLRRNPELAETAGKLMVSLIEVNQTKKAIVDLFKNPELFKPQLKNGTEQELAEFVEAALASADNALKFNNLPPGAFEKIVEEAGNKMLATPVVVNRPNNKEVVEANS